ncbi:unnamed protein product, partial [Heterosigma akashiwo]
VPKSKRRTYRQAEKNTGVNRGQIARMIKKGEVKSKSSYSRPKLSRWHEYLRMKFCFRRKYIRGQIAMHAFTAMTAAKVSSHRRPAGTLELKPINVNKDVYLEAMINQILPSIKEHWLKMGKKQTDRLYIQEDNASPHKLRKDPRWVEAVRGWNIRLLPQPPQSPDLNKNDLGFFHSLQTLCWYNDYKSIDELEMKVLLEFNRYDTDNNHQKLRDLELTHQLVMKEILLTKGQVVSIPHIHKQKLRKAGKLP